MKVKRKALSNNIFWGILIVGSFWVIYIFRALTGPLVISALIAYILYPGVSWLTNKTPLERKHVVPLAYITFVLIFVGLFLYLSPIIIQQARTLTYGLKKIPQHITSIEEDMEQNFEIEIPLQTLWMELQEDTNQFLKPERVFRIIQQASANIVWVILIFVTSFYLIKDWEKLREALIGIAPVQEQPDIRRLHQEIKKIWKSYLRGQLLVMFLLFCLSWLGAVMIGLPGALFLGFLAGTLALIPTLGPAVATAIAALTAWVQGSTYLPISNLGMVILAVLVFQVVQLIEGIWLTPQIMGKRLRLHPGLVFVAVVGSLTIVGATLALIIVPLIGSIELIIRFANQKRKGLSPWDVEVLTPSDSKTDTSISAE